MQITWAILVATLSLTQAAKVDPGVHDDITLPTTIHRDSGREISKTDRERDSSRPGVFPSGDVEVGHLTRVVPFDRDSDLGADQGQTVEKFDWAQVYKQDVPGGVNVAWNWWPSMGEPAVFAGTFGNKPVDLNLRTLGPAICSQLTDGRYAIVSRLGYENILRGGYLEMLSAYAPTAGGHEVTFSSRTTADSGPVAQIEGTEANRLLVLPFDATSFKGKLLSVELNLHLEGHGAVHLGETRLVQYPSGFPSSFGTVPKPPDETKAMAWIPTVAIESWFEFRSFLLGVVLTLGAGAFPVSISILRRVVKSRRHEREMRRIASLDG